MRVRSGASDLHGSAPDSSPLVLLVIDTINRLPQTGSQGVYLKQQLQDKLVEHKHYIEKYGEDMPEIRNWAWPA